MSVLKLLPVILLSCAAQKPIHPLAFISLHGVQVLGEPGEWLTPEMATWMETDLLWKLGDEPAALDCMSGAKVLVVDRLPSGAGAHVEFTDNSRRRVAWVNLARKRACAVSPGEKGPTYEWALAHVILTCLGKAEQVEDASIWQGIARTGWLCPLKGEK